ncbi:hypothetical protein BVRB_2g041420 [Beta vulgaris subsp. vulgaris]|nr:hypothetical protein BVRB_2g041420 [Beta vulgaris subsp. vulgaris]
MADCLVYSPMKYSITSQNLQSSLLRLFKQGILSKNFFNSPTNPSAQFSRIQL